MMLDCCLTARRVALAMLVVFAMLTPRAVLAESLTLAWDANPEADVQGYYVFVGTSSGVYTTVIDVGTATNFTYSSALPGTTYYLTVAAYIAGHISGPHAPEIITTTGTGPVLSNPGDRTNTRNDTVSLTLSATDADSDPITFGGWNLPTGLSLNTSSGLISGVVTTPGTFNTSVTATDTNANVTTQSFVWTVVPADEAPPTIAISGPTSAATHSASSSFITLTGTANDDVGVTSVTWANSRGGSGTAAGTSSWSVVIPLQSGSNVLTMTARDAKDKSATATLTVATDFYPTVTISSPTSASAYTTSTTTLALSGSAWDDNAVSTVRWSSSRGGSGTTTGTTSWSVSGITLLAGANVITVTAQDGAGHSATATLSVTHVPPPLQITSFAANKTAPQPAGTSITFSTAASGGSAPYQYKWWVFNGSSWSVEQDWSSSSSLTWTPSSRNDNYRIGVWVRSAGQTSDVSDNDNSNRSMSFAISGAPAQTESTPSPSSPSQPASSGALTLTTLVSNVASPQSAGTTVTFTAAASGGSAPYQYKWWVFNGASWSIAQDWSGSSTFGWTPTAVNPNYKVGVWVRSAGSTADMSDNALSNASVSFAILGGGSSNSAAAPAPSAPAPSAPSSSSQPLSLMAVVPDKNAPQAVGTTITFTAAARDGAGPYQYKWWLYNGSSWVLLRDWSTSSSQTWTPSAAGSAYRIGVWVRNAGSTADASENASSNGSVTFSVSGSSSAPIVSSSPSSPLRLVTLSTSRTSPQPTGSSVTVTAVATGGDPQYMYKWWLLDGRGWTVLSDWSQNASMTWTPSTSGSYRIGVWVRSSSSRADSSDNDLSNGSVAIVAQ